MAGRMQGSDPEWVMPRGLTPYNPPMDPVAEIKKLYYAATKATIQNDLARAIDLLKTLPTEDDREKVAVYMDGLSQMRSEWNQGARGGVKPPVRPGSGPATSNSRRPAAGPRSAPVPGRSGPSTGASRRRR